MNRYKFLVSSTLLVFIFCGISRADQFKDYSGLGDAYKILKNVRLDALAVTFLEKRKVVVFDQPLEASIFKIKTREVADAVSGPNPYSNVYTDLDIVYELAIGFDDDRSVHDRLVGNLYSFYTGETKANFQGGFIPSSPDSFLLFNGVVETPDVIWFDGKFIRVSFRYFDSKIRRRERAENTETFSVKKFVSTPVIKRCGLNELKTTLKASF